MWSPKLSVTVRLASTLADIGGALAVASCADPTQPVGGGARSGESTKPPVGAGSRVDAQSAGPSDADVLFDADIEIRDSDWGQPDVITRVLRDTSEISWDVTHRAHYPNAMSGGSYARVWGSGRGGVLELHQDNYLKWINPDAPGQNYGWPHLGVVGERHQLFVRGPAGRTVTVRVKASIRSTSPTRGWDGGYAFGGPCGLYLDEGDSPTSGAKSCTGTLAGSPVIINGVEYYQAITIDPRNFPMAFRIGAGGHLEYNGSTVPVLEKRVLVDAEVEVCSGTTCAGPKLAVEPPRFGQCPANRPLVLRNVGTTPLTISSIGSPREALFEVQGARPLVLQPGESTNTPTSVDRDAGMYVRFSPRVPQDYRSPRTVTDSIVIVSDDGGEPGTRTVVPLSATIPSVEVAKKSRREVTDLRPEATTAMFVETVVSFDCDPRVFDHMVGREHIAASVGEYPWHPPSGTPHTQTATFRGRQMPPRGERAPALPNGRRVILDPYNFANCWYWDCAPTWNIGTGWSGVHVSRADGYQKYQWKWIGDPDEDRFWNTIAGAEGWIRRSVQRDEADQWSERFQVWDVPRVAVRNCRPQGCQ